MTERSARILLRFDWADAAATVTRLWLGAGVYVDGAGEIWKGAALVDDEQLEDIEQAINGEAARFTVGLSGVSPQTAGLAWDFYQGGNLIDSTLQILIQACDRRLRPAGTPRVVFTGRVDDVSFEDVVSGETTSSSALVLITNKFSLRRLTNGAVLSDADQRARAAVLNPEADPDRFAERVPLMQNKTVVWPRYS